MAIGGLALVLTPAAIAQAQNRAFLETHSLVSRWELVDTARNGTFLLTPYKPVYLLPAVWSSSPNGSPNAVSRPNDPVMALDVVECKFQISFKTKLLQGLYKKKGDVWVAYTQSSRWQVYNYGLSRSFRETNYEPEVMVVYPTNYRFLGFRGRLLSAGLNHQSNGGSDPLSRSWNRLIVQAAFERGRYTVLLRPWWRIPERPGTDDNRYITTTLGNAEVVVIFQLRSHVIALQARSAVVEALFDSGSVQGDWSFTISGHLKGHVQVFHGYGESLIDYDHPQTTIGVGVSLLDWL